MNQPSKETKMLLLQLMRKTSLPLILKEVKTNAGREQNVS